MGKKTPQFRLKTPKGTKDWDGKDIVIRDQIFSSITKVLKRHGAVTIDTPVFERKEILAGKYGEDSKLIYDLQDQGGELCSLRYDLTVPFARWLAMNPAVQNIKRYHLAKVYRRDQPAMKKGRMREFYQCDFDIAGAYDAMLPDAEILRVTSEVFAELGWKEKYTIKINHRKLLDGIFDVCGVPAAKIRTISSAVDKLDKAPWSEVRREMTEEKGLAPEVADAIGDFVNQSGLRDVLDRLRANPALAANKSAQKGLDDMETLFTYLEAFDVLDKVSFDLSLARGLDYYTGVIYEVVTEGSAAASPPTEPKIHRAKRRKAAAAAAGPSASTPAAATDAPDSEAGSAATNTETTTATTASGKSSSKRQETRDDQSDDNDDDDRSADPTVGVGSIAAGGRYDDLVGMFSGKAQIPCVGISFGIDRIFSLTKARLEAEAAAAAAAAAAASDGASGGGGGAGGGTAWDKIRPADVDVYVMAFGGGKGFTGLLPDRMQTARRLWEAGVTAEFAYRVRPKLPAQFRAAEAARVPFAVILGDDELARGQVRIKELGLPPGAPDKDGVLVPLAELVPQLKRRLRRKKQQELGVGQGLGLGRDGGEADDDDGDGDGDDGGSALAARVESVIFEG